MPGNITNITGPITGSDLTVMEMKTLKHLRHTTLGIWNSATPENPSQVANGGTALFRAQKYIQFEEYTAANRFDTKDLVKNEITVKIDILKAQKATYEVESLELPGLGIETRGQYLAYIQDGMQLAFTAVLDAHYINAAVTAAEKNKATNEIIDADFFNLDTEAKQKGAYRKVARALTMVSRQLTRYNFGSNVLDYNTFLHKDVQNDLLLAMPKGGDSATVIGKELATRGEFTNIAGLGPIKDHIFLGQKIAAKSAMSKDEDFDFSEIAGIMAHKEAIFLAIQGYSITPRINGAGNQEYIAKFNMFKGAVRPELVIAFKTNATA